MREKLKSILREIANKYNVPLGIMEFGEDLIVIIEEKQLNDDVNNIFQEVENNVKEIFPSDDIKVIRDILELSISYKDKTFNLEYNVVVVKMIKCIGG